jgi:hypothetical protein
MVTRARLVAAALVLVVIAVAALSVVPSGEGRAVVAVSRFGSRVTRNCRPTSSSVRE